MNIHSEIMKVLEGVLIMKSPITHTSLKKFQWVPPISWGWRVWCSLWDWCTGSTKRPPNPWCCTSWGSYSPRWSTQPPPLFYAPVAASLRTRNTVFPMESGSTAWRVCSFFLPHIIFSIHKHVRLSHLVSVHHHSGPVWCHRISEWLNKLITHVSCTCVSVHICMYPKPVCLILKTHKYPLYIQLPRKAWLS